MVIEDPYIRATHQIGNFVRFCETVVKSPTVSEISLLTSFDQGTDLTGLENRLEELKQSLLERDILLSIQMNKNIHDREIRIDDSWVIKIGRGLDFYQRPEGWFTIGANDFSLRPCLETKVDVYKKS